MHFVRLFFPAALVALFAVAGGSFARGAEAWAVILGHLALGSVVLLNPPRGSDWLDPLALGRRFRWLPWAVVVSAGISTWLSPVSRAGRIGLILAPLFLLLPSLVAWVFADRDRRSARLGALGLAFVGVGLAVVGVAGRLLGWSERAAEPLGHHNFQAFVLVVLLPFAFYPLLESWSQKQETSGNRIGLLLAGASAVIIGVGIWATGSLSGLAAMVVQIFCFSVLLLAARRRQRRDPEAIGGGGSRRLLFVGGAVLALVILAAGFAQRSRLGSILSGEDASFAARAVYFEAGVAGVLERPWFGHGAGSTAWTLAETLRPVPGVNPPGEIVGDLHLVALTLAYELGLVGLLLASVVVVVFFVRRLRELFATGYPAPLACGLASLVGAAICGLGTGDWRVVALPLTISVAAGMALVAERKGRGGCSVTAGTSDTADSADRAQVKIDVGRGRRISWIYLGLGVLLLSGPDRAHWHYDQAIRGSAQDPTEISAALDRSVALDPTFPLYRARRAWLERRGDEALRAAQDAHGVATLWLIAGALELQSQSEESLLTRKSLQMACRLSPFDPFAPYLLAASRSTSDLAPALAARAVLSHPQLLAGDLWRDRELAEAALDRIGRSEGVEMGLRQALIDAYASVSEVGQSVLEEEGQAVALGLRIDRQAERSGGDLSLFSFRRSPWPIDWPLVEVDLDRISALPPLPSASELSSTDRTVFATAPECSTQPVENPVEIPPKTP